MRKGMSNELRAVLPDSKIYAEAVIVASIDERNRQTEFDAATLTALESWPAGYLTIAATNIAVVSAVAGSDHLANLTGTRPFPAVAFEVDDAIGDGAELRKVQVYLTRKRSSASASYDGAFSLRTWRIDGYGAAPAGGFDIWRLAEIARPNVVRAASMSADTELVTFSFAAATLNLVNLPAVTIGERLRPTNLSGGLPDVQYVSYTWPPVKPIAGRTLVFTIEAIGGSNSNYAWEYDSGAAADATTVGAGTLHHVTCSLYATNQGRDIVTHESVVAGTGMPRITVSLGQFQATGTASFTGGQKLDLGTAPTATEEFIIRKSTPTGTSITVQARVTTTDAWVTVKDGQTPADVGLATSQSYHCQALFTSNATRDATPILYAVGIQDRTTTDLTDLFLVDSYNEQVDPLTGQYALPECHARVLHVGDRDYLGLEYLFSQTALSGLQIRLYIGHPDLSRDKWLFHSLWDIDDINPKDDCVELVLVSAAISRLKGRFPTTSGTLYGYFLKSSASDVATGDDFGREMSESAEAANTITVSVASGASEISKACTPANVPNLLHWPTGNLRTLVNVATATSTNILLKVRWQRVDSAGASLQSTPYTDEQRITAAGSYSFTLANMEWSVGAVTDRFQVEYTFRNDNATAVKIIVIDTGTPSSETRGPWIHTTQTAPVSYANATLQAVWLDWVSQVGLPERYQGSPPPAVDIRVTKLLMDTEGQRELERISRLGGGTITDIQGRGGVRLRRAPGSVGGAPPSCGLCPLVA